MNRVPTKTLPRKRRKSPCIVARFDVTDDRQHTLHAAMKRLQEGASPLWRTLAMRQVGHLVFEAAKCLPRIGKRARLCIITWNAVDCGISWQEVPSQSAVLRALRAAF